MKFILRVVFFSALAICASYLSPLPCFSEISSSLWQTQKSQHFIIYYEEASSGYISELTERAEKYYNSIIDSLGYRRFEFWSWDNRAKIYLYRDSAEYLQDTQRTVWSGASVDVKNRTIKTFIGQNDFFDSILPHEMTHIIFREFIGYKTAIPLWMEEGVACSQEASSLGERLKATRNLIDRGIYIEVERLSFIKDYSLVVPHIFYAESASLIVFLLEQYGRERFLDFSRRLKDGTDWQEALKGVYHFKDLNDFTAQWKEYTLKKAPLK